MPTSKARQAAKLPCDRQRKVLNRVRERMAELPGMTVEELMRRSNLGRASFYNYEKCRRPLDMETVREFERALYLRDGELFKLAGWLPASLDDFAGQEASVRVSIEHNPVLSRRDKEYLLLMFEGLLRGRRRRKPPGPST